MMNLNPRSSPFVRRCRISWRIRFFRPQELKTAPRTQKGPKTKTQKTIFGEIDFFGSLRFYFPSTVSAEKEKIIHPYKERQEMTPL